jgi:hypothetical protein
VGLHKIHVVWKRGRYNGWNTSVNFTWRKTRKWRHSSFLILHLSRVERARMCIRADGGHFEIVWNWTVQHFS